MGVCTASRELGDPHPLCLPAPDFSSENVQGMRKAASPKPCSGGKDSLSPQIQGEDDGGRVDLWEPLEEGRRKGIRSQELLKDMDYYYHSVRHGLSQQICSTTPC